MTVLGNSVALNVKVLVYGKPVLLNDFADRSVPVELKDIAVHVVVLPGAFVPSMMND